MDSVTDTRIETPWRTRVCALVTLSLVVAVISQMVSAQEAAVVTWPTKRYPKNGERLLLIYRHVRHVAPRSPSTVVMTPCFRISHVLALIQRCAIAFFPHPNFSNLQVHLIPAVRLNKIGQYPDYPREALVATHQVVHS